MIRTKSVYSKIERTDGLRLLVTRFRGHRLPSSRYHVWMPNLGPSEKLLRAFKATSISWSEFARRYRNELFESPALDTRNATIKNHGQKFTLRLLQHLASNQTITLLCLCDEDEKHCHRHTLQKLLLQKI